MSVDGRGLSLPWTADYQQVRVREAVSSRVYLTLDHLERAGLLRRMHIEGRMVFDSNTQIHDHACCRNCGTILDLPSVGCSDAPGELNEWQVEGESRLWTGLCPDCIKSE